MTEQIDYNDAAGRGAAEEMLRRHDNFELEANITSAIRQFLTQTGLAKSDEIMDEDPSAAGQASRVDLVALDTFIEVKRRIGSGSIPNDDYVRQLDDYLRQSANKGRVRMGILTDGKHWVLRWPNAGPVKTSRPYAYTLNDADRWGGLHEWLRNEALVALEGVTPDRAEVEKQFGPKSPRYEQEIRELKTLYGQHASYETIRVKRRLWFDLLRTAIGEIARNDTELDDLFVRHTYLSAVIGMALQSRFGIDIRQLADNSASDLLTGYEFHNKTGLQGVIESDFFTWPNEVGGASFLRALARRVARFDWQQAPADLASILYEAVIPAEERRQLGEYYTPDWLARAMVRELVPEPLGKTILDPACGSGTFVVEAVGHVLEAAKDAALGPKETLDWLRISVVGVDIHPVAVHLARASWVLAAQPAIQDAIEQGFSGPVTVPIYLGDSLELGFRTDDMFSEHQITIFAKDEDGDIEAPLAFPRSLVNEAETFDALMSDVSAYIAQGGDPLQALDDHRIGSEERQTLQGTIAALQELQAQGRDHIWAYYTRNMVRPVVLSQKKVDVIIGNPPWINYNQTKREMRAGLEVLSKQAYDIWQGGRYATHQDVAGLFFARSADLYLKDGGVIGMVMPHSALQTGQYAKWRTGSWTNERGLVTVSVDFSHKTAWDLESLEPNNFFPIPASVAFAKRLGTAGEGVPLAGQVERWRGTTGSASMFRERVGIIDTSIAGESPYKDHSRQGATIVPRRLYFVEETENTAIIAAAQSITVIPRRGQNDKKPWSGLDLTNITGQTIETAHVFDVHLGETVVPYATLEPLKAVLPFKRGDGSLPTDKNGVGGIRLGSLQRRMRERWRTITDLWEKNKARANKLSILGRLDYHKELSAQLDWQKDSGGRPLRLVYSSSGEPTAALLQSDDALVDYTLFWTTCKSAQEGSYLLAILNSQSLYSAVSPFMAKGQFGARHLQKHVWRLPIPEFDASNALHVEISEAGKAAAAGVAKQLDGVRQRWGDKLTCAIARRESREWLKGSDEGKAVERVVGRLLGG